MSGLTRIQRFDREYFPTIANNSTDAEHDLDIGASRVWVSNGTDELLIDFAARIKRIDAAWAAGTNQGGLSTGTVANNTWYYLYAVYNPTTNTADYIIDPSASSPTLPSGYTYSRRVRGAILTDGSANIRGFGQVGHRFIFNSLITDLAQTSSFNTTETLRTISCPPNFVGLFRLVFICTNNSATFSVYETVNPKAGATSFSGGALGILTLVPVRANASRQIASKLDSTAGVVECYIQTHGFEEFV